MRQLIFLASILLSTSLVGQDFTTNLQHPNDHRSYEFFSFPNLETNEIYAIAFHDASIENPKNTLWKINMKTNETRKSVIPSYLINDYREVRNVFYYNNHIFCLNQMKNKILRLQPLALEGKATIKPQLISLADGNEQYIVSKFIANDLYIFTASRKKRLLKIYKIDLEKEEIDIMQMNITREDILTLRVGGGLDERFYTRVIDHNDFNHPNQLLVENKVYFENDKIILLQQSFNRRDQSILHQIDFETKTSKRIVVELPHSSLFVNTAYHNNYIYRFSGGGTNMIVDAYDLTSDRKTVRYITNSDTKTLPFQTSPAKRISFSSDSETPIVTSYQSNKLFRRPFTGVSHRTLGLIEGQDSFRIYVGYTPLEMDEQFLDIPAPPHMLNYYFIETNLPPIAHNTSNTSNFKVPNFAKVIAKCHNENLRTRMFNARDQKFIMKNEVAGIQIHRLDDGYYGTYFDRKTQEFGFKKLVDLE